jgi:hypothetical protein
LELERRPPWSFRYDDEVRLGDMHMHGLFEGLVEGVDIVTSRDGSRYVFNEEATRSMCGEAALEALRKRGISSEPGPSLSRFVTDPDMVSFPQPRRPKRVENRG